MLYTNEMWGAPSFSYNGVSAKLLMQIYLQKDNRGIPLCLFGVGKERAKGDYLQYLLLKNQGKGKLSPIPRDLLPQIMEQLRAFTDAGILSGKLSEIYDPRTFPGKGLQRVNLSARLQCEIDDTAASSRCPSIQVKIGDSKFSIQALTLYCLDGLDHRVCFETHVSNVPSLRNYHLLAGAQLLVDEKIEGEFFPTALNISGDFFTFHGITQEEHYASSSRLQKLKYTTNSNSPVGIMDFLFSSSGLKDRVSIPENELYNWYMVIIPIAKLSIEQEFGLGSVSFITKDHNELKRISEHIGTLFDEYSTFALVHVNEHSLFKAYTKAKNQINLALQLMINLVRDDSPCQVHGLSEKLQTRSMDVFDASIEITSWFYLECTFPLHRLFGTAKSILNSDSLHLSKSTIDSLMNVEDIELQLLKASSNPKSIQAALFNALKWVSKAWESDDEDDQVIYAIIALEFVVARENGTPLLSKNVRKRIKDELLASIRKHMGDEITDDEAVKLSEKFDRNCTETPFMAKLIILVQRLSIPVSTSEIELISRAREKRNGIVHGKGDAELTRQELRLLCEVISTIAFYKLKEEIAKDGDNCCVY